MVQKSLSLSFHGLGFVICLLLKNMTPEEITSDGDEEILQEYDSSEPDDIEEMREEDD